MDGEVPQRQAGPGRAAFGALSVALAAGLLLTGWQIWPSSAEPKATETPVAAIGQQSEAGVQPPAPQSGTGPSVQVADAGPAPSYSTPVDPASPPPPSGTALQFDPTPIGGHPATSAPAAAVAAAAQPETSPPPAAETPAAPATSDVTGAVGKEASLAENPDAAGGLVDLNTGSFEELNTIEGGGPVGRAIIKGRPYTSPEQLVTKKVLRRSIYEKIKDKITVR